MKKTFTLVVLMLLLAVPTFSAFVDVPADHWAYDALDKAIKSGILEGYPDGTYKGQRNMSRYELAMVIARLLDYIDKIQPAKGEVTSAELEEVKNIIKKLAAEFKDELAALEVKVDENGKRITELEKKVAGLKGFLGTLKVSGTLRQRVDVVDTDCRDLLGSCLLAEKTEPKAGYELFGYLAVEGKAGDNVDVLVELDTWNTNASRTTRFGSDDGFTLTLDQAFALIDMTKTAAELDSLKTTVGYQYFKLGPYGLLADNGYAANPALRVDLAKDRISLTGIAAVLTLNNVEAGKGSDGGDKYVAGRLGIDLSPVKLGVNYLGQGVGLEKGWGVDLDAKLLTKSPYLTGLRAEYLQMTDDQVGSANPFNNINDYSYIVGLDVYKTDRAKLTLSYADISALPGATGVDVDPFLEFDEKNTTLGGQVIRSYESGAIFCPDNFKGWGAEGSYTLLKDLTIKGKVVIGDYNENYPATVGLKGERRTGVAAIGISKPINDEATLSIQYMQAGKDPMILNRIRGELLVNF